MAKSILLIIYLLFLIKKINNECEKDTPILFNGECENIYCTEEQFNNKECIISNSNLKIQWLSKINTFEIDAYSLEIIEMPNKDIIFLFFSYLNSLYIYGLKNSGQKYFNNDFISFDYEEENFKGVGLSINNKLYPLICNYQSCVLIDFENNNNVHERSFKNFLKYEDSDNIWSFAYTMSITKLDNNKILFGIFSEKTSLMSLLLSIINIETNDLSLLEGIKNEEDNIIPTNSISYETLCFVTKKQLIECLYIKDSKYQIAIYNLNLNYLNSIILDNISNPPRIIKFPLNCIHLKEEIGIFTYYIDRSLSLPLHIQINELYLNEESNYIFKNVIEQQNIFKITMNNDNDLGDHSINEYTSENLIKISDNKFSYIYLNENDNIILLIIFDLYGNNYQNLLVRYYKINLDLYNINFIYHLKLFNFNSFIGLALAAEYSDSSSSNGIFIIFGYPNNEFNEEIEEIILNISKNNKGIIIKLNINNDLYLDNNLFGYELGIKVSIPTSIEGIKIYSIMDYKEISLNEITYVNDSILFDLMNVYIQLGDEYIIEIATIIRTPKYDKFISLYDKVDQYREDYINYYERNIIKEKKYQFKFKFICHKESIKICKYPYLTTKTIDNEKYIVIYLSDFDYEEEEKYLLNLYLNNYNSNEYCNNEVVIINEYNYTNNCFSECPFCYFPDSSNNCIFACHVESQYLFNSKFYDNCPEGTKEDIKDNQKICKCNNLYYIDDNLNNICLSSLICDENHPILNEETKECMNYRVKYGNNYYLECPENMCISQKNWNLKLCEKIKLDTKIFNGICFNNYSNIIDKFEEMGKKNLKIIDNKSITINVYSYNNDYSINFDKLLQNNINITMIDLRDCISLYKKYYNVENDIYIVTIDTPRKYSNETINNFNFELYFDNKTKIDNLDICKNIKMKVYSPIIYSEIISLELAKYFYEQGGYNIFNKNDSFYNDVCSSAYYYGNDMTLNDRYIDIYPHDIQICPKDCECLGFNLTTNIFICDCEIKVSNNYEYELEDKNEILQYFKDFKNILAYFSDLINYKIIKCYYLFFDYNNFKNNTSFYVGICFFFISLTLIIIFRLFGYKKLRLIFYNNFYERKKAIFNDKNNLKENKEIEKKQLKISKNNTDKILSFDSDMYSNTKNARKNTRYINSLSGFINNKTNTLNNNELLNLNKINEKKLTNEEDDLNKDMKNIEYNELTFNTARMEDNRNIFKIFLSFFMEKIELIKIIFVREKYSNIYFLFNLYLLNYFIDLFMNCILYNDYAISQKYHNNGSLDFITSLVSSLLSNIISSFILLFINKLGNYTMYVETITLNSNNINQLIKSVFKFFRIIMMKFIILMILEILLGLFMVYYLFLFGVINSKSINSFMLNYGLSQIDSIFYSFCLSLIISLLRKISLLFNWKRLYIISRYINEHF